MRYLFLSVVLFTHGLAIGQDEINPKLTPAQLKQLFDARSKVANKALPTMDPLNLHVGEVGHFPTWSYKVDGIASATESTILPTRPAQPARPGTPIESPKGSGKYVRVGGTAAKPAVAGRPFVLLGVDTSKWADGARVEMKAVYKVTGTKKIGSATLFVIEPQ